MLKTYSLFQNAYLVNDVQKFCAERDLVRGSVRGSVRGCVRGSSTYCQ